VYAGGFRWYTYSVGAGDRAFSWPFLYHFAQYSGPISSQPTRGRVGNAGEQPSSLRLEIIALGKSYHSPDGIGCRHFHFTGRFCKSLEKGAWSASPRTLSLFPWSPVAPITREQPWFRSLSGTVTALQSLYLQSPPRLVHLWFLSCWWPRIGLIL